QPHDRRVVDPAATHEARQTTKASVSVSGEGHTGPMAQTTDGTASDAAELEQKQILKKYLYEAREALLWKLEGLTEKQARWPLVPSGNNLLGIVKHCANIE